MWFLDKYGNSINSNQIMSLYVASNSDSSGSYEVQANNASNTMIAQFAVNVPMTQAQAESLLARMSDLLGVTDLSQ